MKLEIIKVEDPVGKKYNAIEITEEFLDFLPIYIGRFKIQKGNCGYGIYDCAIKEDPYFYRLEVRDYIIIDEDGNLDTIRNKGGEFKRNYVIIPESETIYNPTIIEKHFMGEPIRVEFEIIRNKHTNPERYLAKKVTKQKTKSQSPTNRYNCQQFICDFCHKSKNEVPIKVTNDTDNLNICHDCFYGKFYYKEDEYIVED